MKFNWRVLVTLLLVVFGIAATYNLLTRGKVYTTVTSTGGLPDYVLSDFELVALDATGQEAFTVRAPSLVRDELDQHLDLKTPVFRIPPSAKGGYAVWDVISETAWVGSDNQEIRLRGKVVANTKTRDGKLLKVSTEQLNVFPEKQLAIAPVLATVNQPGLTITGQNGLEAEMQTQRVTFRTMRAHYNGR